MNIKKVKKIINQINQIDSNNREKIQDMTEDLIFDFILYIATVGTNSQKHMAKTILKFINLKNAYSMLYRINNE